MPIVLDVGGPGPFVISERAGGRLTGRAPADYGSAAGELAVCIRALGLANRSELAKLVIHGPGPSLDALVGRVTGDRLAPGGTCPSGRAWWCRSEDRVVVLVEPEQREHLSRVLRIAAQRHGSLRVDDRTNEVVAIAVLGARLPELLVALGALEIVAALRSAQPFSRVVVAGSDVRLLLQSDRRAILLAELADADRVWSACIEAGRPLRLGLVGSEAARRFALFDSMRTGRSLARL